MKKLLPGILLIVFGFSFCNGQVFDTLVFKAGTKLAVKIFYIDKQRIYFTAPPGREKESVTKDQLDTVIYAKGFTDPILPDYDSTINQRQKGNLIINFGIGYSPEFDGDVGFGGLFFPIQRNSEYFSCYSITPNVGITADYGLNRKWSFGLAASYQSEIVRDNDYSLLNPNKLTRTNWALRLLKHLSKRNPNIDDYIGLRVGYSYWIDKPILTGENQYSSGVVPPFYFINKPNAFVPSFQVLYGLRGYISSSMGIHFEIGIGSPYLAEGGLSFRFKTRKGK